MIATNFSTQDWSERQLMLGDPAEKAFEQWATDHSVKFARYGLLRPDIDLRYIPAYIRYSPDYITDRALVEVQGCGHDQTFKFKHDKLWALCEWDLKLDVEIWLWNAPLKTHAHIGLSKLFRLCNDALGSFRTDGMFDNTKPYAAVTWDMLFGYHA